MKPIGCLLAVLTAALIPCHAAAPPAPDRLPPRAVGRLGSDRYHHGPGITSAVISPDGTRLASAAEFPSYARYVLVKDRDSYARTILLWDAATGQRLRAVRAPGRVWGLAFSPDGKSLAASCEGGVALFDIDSGTTAVQWKTEELGRPQFSPDGKRLHLLASGGVTSWEVVSGKRIRQASAPSGAGWIKEREHVVDTALSPDGKFIVWSVWQSPDYSKLPLGAMPPPPVPRPTTLIVTDAATDRPLYRKDFKDADVRSVGFSRDGKRFVLLAGVRVTVRDSATGNELAAQECSSAFRVGLAPDGRHVILAGGDSCVRVWDATDQTVTHELTRGLAYINSDTLRSPQGFSADGKWLLLATDSTLRLFDTTTGKEGGPVGQRTPIVPRFSPDGRMLLTTCAEYRCRWRLSPGEAPALLAREARNVWEGICGDQALAHSADGRLFVGREGVAVRLRETTTGNVRHVLEKERRVYFGRFSPDASRLLLCRELLNLKEPEVFRLYDVATGKSSGGYAATDDIGMPAFSPDGRLIAWAERDAVHVHDGVTGKPLRTLRSTSRLPRPDSSDAELLFSPGGEYLAAAAYLGHTTREDAERYAHPLRVFHVRSGKQTARFHADPEKGVKGSRLACWAWSPDGRLLAVAAEGSGTVKLLEIASGQVRAELVGHRHGVRGLAFSPDGATLASGGEDNVALLWDVTGVRAASVGRRELAAWWDDLARDARRAGDAVTAFHRAGGAGVRFLAGRVRPVEPPTEKRLARLIADLASDSFKTRSSATDELERLGGQAEAALRSALKGKPDLEASRRIEALLERLEQGLPPETVRDLRAIEVLERVGTVEAVRALEALAKGGPDARQTIAAKEALRRRTAK